MSTGPRNATVRRHTIDITADCQGGMDGDNRITCSWDRGYGTNKTIRAAARRHALSTGHRVSVEEITDTTYSRLVR